MSWYRVLRYKDPIEDVRFRTKVFPVFPVDSWTRTWKDDTYSLLFSWSTRGYFKDELCIVSSKKILGMIVSGQEKSGKNKLFQCLGKVREFQFESENLQVYLWNKSGKIYRYIFESSQGKMKFQVKGKLFILSWSSWWLKMVTLSFLMLIMYIVLNSCQIPDQCIFLFVMQVEVALWM